MTVQPLTIPPLTWALVIATYKRSHILPRCLKMAAQQTRQPQEVIVVDASPDWEQTREQVTQEFSHRYPQIQLTYVQATRPSTTAQRNQGVALASADVLFLIDDDSLMYPTCAEEVMQVYDSDRQQQIKGVQGLHQPEPPDQQDFAQSGNYQVGSIAVQPRQTLLRRLVKTLLNIEQTYFLPYERTPPAHQVPSHLKSLNIDVIPVMVGYAMTFRRNVFELEQFCEVLERYAACEDQDLSYRVSRHGAIVNALDAKLCHLEISGGRLSAYTVAVLAGLNAAVLHQLYSRDRDYVQSAWRRILYRRVLINFLKEISEKRWGFPKTKGNLYAISQLKTVQAKSAVELTTWYPAFQKQLIAADPAQATAKPEQAPAMRPASSPTR